MKLTKEQLERLKKIGDLQAAIMNEIGYTPKSMISFSTEHYHVIHPTLSECSSYKVDPIEYYGEDFLKSRFMDFID